MPEIEIINDPDPMNPRDWDNLGTFQIYHRRYASPDKIERDPPHINPKTEIGLKVWGYDHGGIVYATGESNPFSCPWDSGFAGIIFAPKERIRRWFGVKRLSKFHIETARKILESEVEDWNRYINGEVYAYLVRDQDGEVIDSCGGFYSEDEARAEAQSYLNSNP